MITLESRALRVVIDEQHGGEIVHMGAPDGRNALFHEPWPTPVAAERSSTYGSGALDWLSRYRGGWQVMFPSAGSESTVDGVPHPVHGELSLTPLAVRNQTPERVTLHGPTRTPLQLTREISVDPERPVLRLEEHAENPSDRGGSYAWGEHIAFMAVVGMRVDLPPGPVHVDEALAVPEADLVPGAVGAWPEAARLDGGVARLDKVQAGPIERVCYLPDRPAGWAALRDSSAGFGLAMAWDPDAFPHLWFWEQIGGWRFPFFGRARIVALEPVSCWPGDGLAAAIERGQARVLGAHGSASAWLTMALFEADERPVIGVDRAGNVTRASAGSSPRG
jgi:hypothetical protein